MKPKTTGVITVRSEKNISFPKKNPSKTKTSALDNLLQEMVGSESETEEVLTNKRGFSSKVAKI